MVGKLFTGEIDMTWLGIGIIVYLILMLLAYGWMILSYVLTSTSMYSAAKRRGIHKPWLAWIPLGNMWILGSISDQYQYVTKGKIKNKRKALLILGIVMYVLMIPVMAMAGSIAAVQGNITNAMLTTVFAFWGCFVLCFGVVIAAAVIQYMALYDLYGSCDPKNQVVYILLSILVSVTMPFLIFGCRKKDLGMPPRKEEVPKFVVQPQPACQPAQQGTHEWEPPLPEQPEETTDNQ